MKKFIIKDTNREDVIVIADSKEEAIEIYNKHIADASTYTYTFPQLTKEDLKVAKMWDLKFIENKDGNTLLSGKLSDLLSYSKDHLGYQLVNSYLSKDSFQEDETFKFGMVEVITSNEGIVIQWESMGSNKDSLRDAERLYLDLGKAITKAKELQKK